MPGEDIFDALRAREGIAFIAGELRWLLSGHHATYLILFGGALKIALVPTRDGAAVFQRALSITCAADALAFPIVRGALTAVRTFIFIHLIDSIIKAALLYFAITGLAAHRPAGWALVMGGADLHSRNGLTVTRHRAMGGGIAAALAVFNQAL